MEKFVLHVLAYASIGGMITSLVGFVAVVFNFQPIYGDKVTYENVIASSLISIAATGLWKMMLDEMRREKKM